MSNSIIRPPQLQRSDYPAWVTQVLHPHLDVRGSHEYDLRSLTLSTHPCQAQGGSNLGQEIYDSLLPGSHLVNCLGLRDALAIQKIPVALFRELFGDKELCFWKSACQDDLPRINVVNLKIVGDGIVFNWDSTDHAFWDESRVTPHFSKWLFKK